MRLKFIRKDRQDVSELYPVDPEKFAGKDTIPDIPADTAKAYKSIRKVKRHPVDIVIGTQNRFEERKKFHP